MLIRVSEIPEEGLTIEGVKMLPEPFHDSSWRLERLREHLHSLDREALFRNLRHSNQH